MEDNIKHTEGKLKAEGQYIFIDKTHIAEAFQFHFDREVNEANAAHIVKCWNAYPLLIEALANLLPILEAERTQQGISLDLRYKTEFNAADKLLNSLNK